MKRNSVMSIYDADLRISADMADGGESANAIGLLSDWFGDEGFVGERGGS